MADRGEHTDRTPIPGEPWPWDERFRDMPWPKDPDPLLVEYCSDLPKGKAVDLGAGTGRNSIFLAGLGYEVMAVDASQVGLDITASRAKSENLAIKTVLANLDDFKLEADTYDLVVIANIHMLPPDSKKLFKMAVEGLRRGGHLFVVGHDRSNLGVHGPPLPELLYSVDDMKDLFPSDLDIKVLKNQERPVGDSPHGVPDMAVVVLGEKK